MSTYLVRGMVALACCLTGSLAIAQHGEDPAVTADRADDSWYYESGQVKIDPQRMHQAKAAQRAAQRNARMASMAWYGMSASRPTASPTPWTGMYSPAWQMPGGRPYAWSPRPYGSTVYIIR